MSVGHTLIKVTTYVFITSAWVIEVFCAISSILSSSVVLTSSSTMASPQ